MVIGRLIFERQSNDIHHGSESAVVHICGGSNGALADRGNAGGEWRNAGLAPRLDLVSGEATEQARAATWALRGVTSNERYVTREEKTQLVNKQQGLGRPEADCGVLIPIRKSPAWWALTQEDRRAIFEAQSNHTATGLKYLPAVARRLHHCRDLGTPEPFDFLTWFEFARSETAGFDRLLAELRATPEWKYVEREVEVRVQR